MILLLQKREKLNSHPLLKLHVSPPRNIENFPSRFVHYCFYDFQKEHRLQLISFEIAVNKKRLNFRFPNAACKEVTSAFNPCQVYKTPVIQLSVNLLEFLEINKFSCRVSLHHLLQIKLLKEVLMYRSFNRSD